MTERTIFLTAIEIADAGKRTVYLDQACSADAELRSQVESLLSSHKDSSQFLETPAAASNSAVEMTIVSHSPEDNDDDHKSAVSSGEAEVQKYLQPATRAGWLGRLAHYEIEMILGRGAFGIVVKAFDEKLHRIVAIKLMNPDLASTSPPRKRFLREARTAAAVRHENIVGIHAVEEEPIPYLVMEYIPGITLQQRLDQHGPLDLSEILTIGQQMAAGMAAAHAANLIHRDIKPSNILLEEGIEVRVKISDFGLARAVDDASLTSSGLIAGTPMYMAPEQARGEILDHRADLFSLGSVLYQMTSGRPPFRAANTMAVLKRVCDDTPRPIQDVIPGIPDWLCSIVFRLLEKKADARFQTAKEVADVFARCQAELQLNGKVTCVTGPQSSRYSSRDEAITSESPPKSIPIVGERERNSVPPRRRWRTALAGFAAIVLMAAVLLIATRSGTVAVTSPDGKLPKDIKVVVTSGGEEIELLQADNQWSAKLVNGEYQVQLRGGEDRFEITNSQLTINRLGRAVVKLEIRPPVAVPQPTAVVAAPATPSQPPTELANPAVPIPVSKPFVVVRAGQDLRTFKTLVSAINELQLGDVIEIRSNERLPIQLAEPVTKPLAILAGAGYRPWLVFVGQGRCDIKADFSVTGCDLDLRSGPFSPFDRTNATWRFHRCRLWGDPAGCASRMQFSESLILSIYGIPAPVDGTATDYEFDNCLIRNCFSLMRYHAGGSHTLRLRNCSFYGVAGKHTRLALLEKEATLTVEATGNVFHCQSQANELIEAQSLPQVTWIGTDNCFSGTWYQVWEGNVLKEKGLPAWNKLWKEPERDSREVDFLAFEWGRVQRMPNPERSHAVRAATETMIAQHRLPEVGPDWSLVGPGAAYVRALAAEGRAVPESELRPERREDGAIVLLRAGKEVRGFVTLTEALNAAQDKDVVELRTDGLIPEARWIGDSRLITIRAGAGYTPTIDGNIVSAGTDRLILEGLTIRSGLLATGDFSTDFAGGKPLYPTLGSLLRMMNCTLLGERGVSFAEGWMFVDGKVIPEIVNCDIAFLRIGLGSGGRARLRNSVLTECRPNVESPTAPPGTLEIEHCVFWAPEPEAISGGESSFSSHSAIKIQAHGSIFVSPADLAFGHPHLIEWTGAGNTFVKSRAFRHGQAPLQLEQYQTEFHTEANSIELPPWEFDPAQWRILRDKSPGYQPRPDGTDYGADVDRLVNALGRNATPPPAIAIAPFNDHQAKSHQAAWCLANSADRTHAVGEFQGNPWGLFDVSGNVWELVQDGFDPTLYAQFAERTAVDPAAVGPPRMIRGGKWDGTPFAFRSAIRGRLAPWLPTFDVGFRVSLTVEAVKEALKSRTKE